ncbi:sigma factor-like helix-turn-helix DNA-binding protein [Nocardiopsis coralliicola]
MAHAFAALRRSFDLLTTPPLPADQDLAGLCGLDAEALSPTGLTRHVLALPAAESDRLWRHLIERARAGPSAWTVIAAGLALPGLAAARRRLSAGIESELDDLEAELLAGFLAALHSGDTVANRVGARLVYAARAAGQRLRYRTLAERHRRADQPGFVDEAAAPDSGGAVTVLAGALTCGVVTPLEAELVARSRLERRPLVQVAQELGVSYSTARRHRHQAQQRLKNHLTGAAEKKAA